MCAIFFLFAFVIASTTAGKIEEFSDKHIIFYDFANLSVESNENIMFEDFESLKTAECCTVGSCLDTCLALGFKPIFSAECLDCNTCRCTQY